MAAKPALWITRRLSDATLARAVRDYDAIINHQDGLHTASEIVEICARMDAVLPCHSEIFDADVIAALPARLKVIANHSVGVDHVDLTAAKAKGIVVTNTPDVLVGRHRRDRHAVYAGRGAARLGR